MIGFTGNNTRLELQEVIMRQLHDPFNQFWAPEDIHNHMQRAFSLIYNEQNRIGAELGLQHADVTYTASAEQVDITSGISGFRRITMVEDRTDSQPGPLWNNEQNLEDLQKFNSSSADPVRLFHSPTYAIYVQQTVAASVITNTIYIRAAPPPTSARTLRIYAQCLGPDFSVETGTSGLLIECENVAIILTCIFAKFQEMDNAPGPWKELHDKAEKDMRKSLRSFKRGPKRVRYLDDD